MICDAAVISYTEPCCCCLEHWPRRWWIWTLVQRWALKIVCVNFTGQRCAYARMRARLCYPKYVSECEHQIVEIATVELRGSDESLEDLMASGSAFTVSRTAPSTL